MTAEPFRGRAPLIATTLSSSSPAGLADLPQFGLLRFSGADAQAFLQGQLSCDVNGLAAGDAVYGSYNTPKGRMLATFLLWRRGGDYWMQLPRSVAEAIRRRVSMYILRSKVVAHDSSDDFELVGATGSSELTQMAPPFDSIPAGALRLSSILGASVLRLDEQRCLLIFDRGHPLRSKLGASVPAISAELWDWTNIVAGV